MSKFKRPACDNVDHGFTSLGSSSVMTKLKRPASKWNNFLDDDNDLELEMSRFEETNNAAFERKFTIHKSQLALVYIVQLCLINDSTKMKFSLLIRTRNQWWITRLQISAYSTCFRTINILHPKRKTVTSIM
ncbi:hypothetical protein CTI12_AA211380 [Artemisia annua]|uniref:Uncharacterized protein n=1 Tax=Artemisia annua TaxID=35608 RepID=A0A2U1NZ93_ARTAN|nr:hypothetical protein CTI12_AA211380 [Artemisia annua]